VILIGERLNSSRASVRQALEARNEAYLIQEARRQVEAGAQFIDFNASALMEKEIDILQWAVPLLQQNLTVPLAIDTPNPQAMAVGLKLHQGQAILNSISAEKSRLEAMLPLIKEFSPLVIALCLDEDGVPSQPENCLRIATRLINTFQKNNIPLENIFLDPLVRPIGVNPEAGLIFLRSLELIKENFPGVKTVAGISNVSFGLPWRASINRTLLILAVQRGLEAAICNPLDKDLMAQLLAAEALLGRDPRLTNFLQFYRQHKDKKK
jgi:5-methyltetrahydrofolate--homocysteine methyltransferase